MRRLLSNTFFTLFIFLPMVIIQPIITNSITANASEIEETNPHIYDKAELLSTEELSDLEDMCIEYGAEAGIEIIILTHEDAKAPDGEYYIEDFYDRTLPGDSVILLVDLYNRDVIIHGYGTAETYIHSKRGDVIISEISPYLTEEIYYTAFEKFVKSSASYMKDDTELNYDHNYNYNYDGTPQGNNSSGYYSDGYNNDNYSSYNNADELLANPGVQLVISLVIGAVVVGIMAHNSGGKMTAGSNTYFDPNNSGLIGRRDQYLRTRVTKVKKPTQNNNQGGKGGGLNSGGFRGGVSSGGHSHSSSRGKF